MPIQSKHPDYNSTVESWQLVRDFYAGSRAVKGKGSKYLPKLSGQDHDDFNAYLNRAWFFNAVRKSVDGLAGFLTLKPASVKDWEKADQFSLENIGVHGEGLEAIKAWLDTELVKIGRCAILVDMADGGTVPYLATFVAEDVWNWQHAMINGRLQLVRVVLFECVDAGTDPYEKKPADQLRELYLAQVGDSWEYRVQLWRKQEGKDEYVRYQNEIVPKAVGGSTFNYIPCHLFNASSNTMKVQEPPLIDLADVNQSHYQNSADLEHGRHLTALPTPVIAGYSKPPATASPASNGVNNAEPIYKIGSGCVWTFRDANTKWGFLEFSGAGLGNIQAGMEHKERLMAVLGSRMLEGQPNGVEAAKTVELRQSGEQASLQTIGRSIGEGLTFCLYWFARFLGTESKVKVQVTPALLAKIDPLIWDRLWSMYMVGRLSWDALFSYLQRFDVLPEGRTKEEEMALIELELGTPMANPEPVANPNAKPKK